MKHDTIEMINSASILFRSQRFTPQVRYNSKLKYIRANTYKNNKGASAPFFLLRFLRPVDIRRGGGIHGFQ